MPLYSRRPWLQGQVTALCVSVSFCLSWIVWQWDSNGVSRPCWWADWLRTARFSLMQGAKIKTVDSWRPNRGWSIIFCQLTSISSTIIWSAWQSTISTFWFINEAETAYEYTHQVAAMTKMIMDESDTSFLLYNHTCATCQIIGSVSLVNLSSDTPCNMGFNRPPDDQSRHQNAGCGHNFFTQYWGEPMYGVCCVGVWCSVNL
jgi:hypothetical protein